MTSSPMQETIYIRIPLKALDDLASIFADIDGIQANLQNGSIKDEVSKGHAIIEKSAGQYANMIYAEDESIQPAQLGMAEAGHSTTEYCVLFGGIAAVLYMVISGFAESGVLDVFNNMANMMGVPRG